MASVIKPKRSAVAGNIPTTAQIGQYEIAMNTADKKIFTSDGTNIIQIASGTISGLGDVNITSPANGQSLSYNSSTGKWVNSNAGTGDVVGPASSTDNAVVRFDGTTGKLIQGSPVTISDTGAISGAESISNIDFVQFDTTVAPVEGIAKLQWDDGNGTLQFGLKGGNVNLQVGQEIVARVYNDSGVALTDGQIVYISGSQGNRIAVKLAKADSEATSAGTLGMVTESIAIGAEGFITMTGTVNKLNTTGLTAGALVYLSATTAGGYTTTAPTAPNHRVILGYVERVDNLVGSIYIKVDNGYELDELHNVSIVTAASGNTLIYDAVAGVWENASLTAGAGISVTNGAGSITIGNTGVTSLTGTANQVTVSASTGGVTLSLPATINVNTSGNAATVTNGVYTTGDQTIGGVKTFSSRPQSSGYSSYWGSTSTTQTGAFNATMGTGAAASWLISGTSGGVFRAGIQALDSDGTLRFYQGTNYFQFSGGTLTATTFSGALSGNATTATTLQTGRTIGMTGDVTYTSGSFNGSANVTGTATLASVGTAGTYTKVTTDAKGRVTSGTTLSASDIPDLTLEKIPDAWVKKSVRAATTANITLSGTQTIDGIALVAGDRVLVKDQTTTSQNGIYVVAAGAWARSADADTINELAGACVNVDSGTVNGGFRFDTDLKSTDTLGTTAVSFYRVLDSNDTASANTANKVVIRDGSGNFSAGTITAALSGNASTASTWQTARTLTIGSTGKSIDGSANVSWSLAEIGAAASTHYHDRIYNGAVGTSSYLALSAGNELEYYNSSGVIEPLYLQYSGAADSLRGPAGNVILHAGNYNSYSPTLTGTGASGIWPISISGNADTVDSIHVAQPGVAPSANQLVRTDSNGYTFVNYINSNTGNSENGTVSQVIITNGSDNYYRKASIAHLTSSIQSNASGTWGISVTGNAATATTLQTARAIGDVAFDGSASIVPQRITFKDTRSTDFTPATYSGISFHLKQNTTDSLADGGTYHGVLHLQQWSDLTGGNSHQLGFTDNNNVYIRQSTSATTWGSWIKLYDTDDADTANTASKLVLRDASGNFSAGTITANLSGNATTATTLQTARTINGVSFNGSANITVADSTKLPLAGGTMTGAISFAAGQTWPTFNQNTTGSAATLTTGRTIGMTGDVTWTSGSFNGSANVTGTATLATVNSNVGSFGSTTTIPVITVNAKGLVTAVSTATVSGGQYFGTAATKAIAYNSNTIAENITITAGNNGLSAGPITIDTGYTVTVATGANWVIV